MCCDGHFAMRSGLGSAVQLQGAGATFEFASEDLSLQRFEHLRRAYTTGPSRRDNQHHI